MDNLSLSDIWLVISGIAGGLILLANAVEKVIKMVKVAKAPNDHQNDRLTALEEWRKTVDRKLENDKTHLDSIDAGNRVTQLALLALLDHGIDGNNIDQMQHAKEELQNHLINR